MAFRARNANGGRSLRCVRMIGSSGFRCKTSQSGEPGDSVILSGAKNLVYLRVTEILRCAQDDNFAPKTGRAG